MRHRYLPLLPDLSLSLRRKIVSADEKQTTRAVEYLKFRSETTVAIMICVVWTISGLISVPPLFYPPWKLPIMEQEEDEIQLSETDKKYLAERNATGIFAHAKCVVSQ